MTDTIKTTDHTDETVEEQETSTEETQETVGNDLEETPEAVNDDDQDDPETFPREYVEKLRAENAENRVKAKRADDLAHRLHEALTAATGRLQDASDLPFDDSHLEDPEALKTAIDTLLESKPHLASRRVMGDIGQGTTGNPDTAVNLAGLLRSRA